MPDGKCDRVSSFTIREVHCSLAATPDPRFQSYSDHTPPFIYSSFDHDILLIIDPAHAVARITTVGATYSSILEANFNAAKESGACKWESIEPSQNSFSWVVCDYTAKSQGADDVLNLESYRHSRLAAWVNNLNDSAVDDAMKNHGLSLLSTRYSTETALFEAWFSLSKSAVISSSRLLSMLAQQTSTPNCTIAIMVSNYRVPSRTVPSQEALLTALACKVIWMLEMFRPTSRLLFRGLQNAAFADVDIGAEYGAPFSTKDEELTLISDQNQGLCSTGKELCYPHHSLCDVGITVGGVHDEDSFS
ncbi:glycoside hydrolase family 10 [Moniliophthora roreri]|nr:glycoside hydrolase family 10 [Moniliophthora roreri]